MQATAKRNRNEAGTDGEKVSVASYSRPHKSVTGRERRLKGKKGKGTSGYWGQRERKLTGKNGASANIHPSEFSPLTRQGVAEGEERRQLKLKEKDQD